MNKAAIYKEYGIEYKAGKIVSPIGMINPLLVDSNSKTVLKDPNATCNWLMSRGYYKHVRTIVHW